jgi:hypothetical protein
MVACRRIAEGQIAAHVAAGRLGGARWALGALLGCALLLVGLASPSRAQFGSATLFGTGGLPQAVAVDDFDGDSRADLATADWGLGKVSVLLGRGDGSFGGPTDFGAGAHPASVAVGDFNGVGPPDLAVANNGSERLGAAGQGRRNLQRPDQLRRRRRTRVGGGGELQRRL